MDFNSSSSGDLLFPPGSTQGALQCITISLLSDIFFEVPENFVIELFSSDVAVTIPESADIAIITINDVPDPQGIGKHSYVYSRGDETISNKCYTACMVLGMNIIIVMHACKWLIQYYMVGCQIML